MKTAVHRNALAGLVGLLLFSTTSGAVGPVAQPWRTDRSDLDPALLHYVCLELGRTVDDTPDAWCYLRETPTKQHPQGVRNFERWLHQRDRAGARTVAVDRYDIEKQNTHTHDFTLEAERGDAMIKFVRVIRLGPASGSHRIP